MQAKDKQLKMIYAVGTYDSTQDDPSKNTAQNVSSVTKKQFKLYIGEVNQHLKGEPISLTPIEQDKSKLGHYQATFTLKRDAVVKKEEIMINFPLYCQMSGNKLNVPEEQFRKMTQEFKKLSQQNQSEEEENSEQESENQLSHRGRGRPKGSKNKKKDQNGEEQSDESFSHCSDYKKEEKKPGKGRPKGSRNKKKDMYDDFSHESNFHALFKKLFQYRSYEEINKRLNRDNSKSKEDMVKLQQNYDDYNAKRSRGRPKGVKNKKNKIEEDGDSEQNLTLDPIPERQPLKKMPKCCSKCDERQYKKLYLQGKLTDKSLLKNIAVNVGVEDTTNILIEVISKNQQTELKELLKYIDSTQNQFLVPWDCVSRLQNVGYTIRTRKDFLVRNQKEMINALLQDRFIHRGKWWQTLGTTRLLENIPHYQDGIEIYQILVAAQPALENVFLQNIPTLVRSGNETLSKYLIEKVIAMEENSQIYGYSKDHLQCLDKHRNQLQFRKASMLKQNCTDNFCSPIHCATINSNTELLSYILKHISQFNVGDSLNRKPIHYAATLESPKAMEILYKFNSDQITQMDKKKVTPLMVAAQFGRYSNIKFILEKIRDKQYINHKSDEGLTALHYAVIRGHEQCVSLLLEDPLVNAHEETKEKFTILHLAAGGGSKVLVQLILSKGIKSTFDNFRRSPLVVALRNHHNDIFFHLLKQAQCNFKRDYSNNTLLHYSAAYGNIELVMYFSKVMDQIPNKKNFYPWEVAVLKGHYFCAQLLELKEFPHHHHLIFLLLKNPRGTPEFYAMIDYLLRCNIYQLNYQYTNMGDTCLHLLCSLSEKEYYEQRRRESSVLRPNEYEIMQEVLIKQLLENGADPEICTEKQRKPVNYCIENENLIGIQLLLKQIPFEMSPATKNNHFVYYLTNIACRGKKEVLFVLEKLSQVDEKILKVEFRKNDCFGFQFIVFLMKNFTQTVHSNFRKNYIFFMNELPETDQNTPEARRKCIQRAFHEYVEHESSLLKLVAFLVEHGADPRSIVNEPRLENENQNYKKWGIQHFLMRFPSLVLLKTFMKWIDKFFNSQNSEGRTPLHLFCMWNREGSLFNTEQINMFPVPHIDFSLGTDYDSHTSLEYLLENGLTSNILDINRSTPLLYAALNGQLKFMNLLRMYGSTINNCNLLNQVPIIEIIKNKQKFTVEEIESILGEHGASADIRDLNERNALHHLVSNATNFDSSPEICKKLLEYGVKINSLDEYGRTPIFYCFIKIRNEEGAEERPNDKVEILQTLLNCDEIDLNIVDCYHKTPLHYACEKNFFFSILYLLDANINYDVEDSQGNTPLAICLKHRMLNQAALLIRKGVKFGYVIDERKKYSYFEYAVTKLSVGICFMLLDHGYPLQKALQVVSNQSFKRELKKKYLQGSE